jgi:hypothetical protein
MLLWQRRLMDARIATGMAPDKAIGAYLAFRKSAEDALKKLHQTGGVSTADVVEAEFQRLEAEKLLANLKNARPPDAIGPGAGGGTGFGGLAPSPAVLEEGQFGGAGGGAGGGLSGDTTRTLPRLHPADADRNKIIEEALEKEVTLSFPKGTPLDEILKYIRLHTKDAQTKLPNGVPIYIDPLVLLDDSADPPAPKPFLTLVPIEFEGIPLRVSLRLILDQFDLGYQVRDRLVYVMATDRLNFVSEGARGFLEATGGSPIVGGMGGGRGGMGGMGGGMGGMGGGRGGMGGMGGGMGGMGGGTGMPGTPKPGGTIK